jgi:hypothetical protein
VAVGTYTVVATYSGDGTHVPSIGTTTVNVVKDTPVITWSAPASIPYGTPLTAQQLNASATVPGVFTYTPGLTAVLPVGSNKLNVSFSPTDNTDYASPVTMSQTLDVTTVIPTVSWPAPASIEYGTPLSSTQLNATADVQGSFVYSPAAGTVLPVGVDNLSVTFTPTNSMDNSSNASVTSSVQIQVTVDSPVITGVLPNPVAAGATVTINGQNFGPSQGSSTVTFNGVVATIVNSWGTNSIVATIPTGTTTGNLVVTVGGTPSNSFLIMISTPCP